MQNKEKEHFFKQILLSGSGDASTKFLAEMDAAPVHDSQKDMLREVYAFYKEELLSCLDLDVPKSKDEPKKMIQASQKISNTLNKNLVTRVYVKPFMRDPVGTLLGNINGQYSGPVIEKQIRKNLIPLLVKKHDLKLDSDGEKALGDNVCQALSSLGKHQAITTTTKWVSMVKVRTDVEPSKDDFSVKVKEYAAQTKNPDLNNIFEEVKQLAQDPEITQVDQSAQAPQTPESEPVEPDFLRGENNGVAPTLEVSSGVSQVRESAPSKVDVVTEGLGAAQEALSAKFITNYDPKVKSKEAKEVEADIKQGAQECVDGRQQVDAYEQKTVEKISKVSSPKDRLNLRNMLYKFVKFISKQLGITSLGLDPGKENVSVHRPQ